ncbi:hypothetical protein K458DRAFT_36263 [Lentithecium fluviatile CBS 122367]|uniref:Uncharacterized protein n=1 Tax=Lentithecium fluviatile CBS 122367 TaxID=1168545 RepID=A0A6G1J140_9PLEO|nr:hypothetical protein K458DRAFT_36263 [Lentithecium fluviatile CBS 122367]
MFRDSRRRLHERLHRVGASNGRHESELPNTDDFLSKIRQRLSKGKLPAQSPSSPMGSFDADKQALAKRAAPSGLESRPKRQRAEPLQKAVMGRQGSSGSRLLYHGSPLENSQDVSDSRLRTRHGWGLAGVVQVGGDPKIPLYGPAGEGGGAA